MESFLRVARPVAVIAAMWALGWSIVGVAFGIIFGLMLGAAASIPVFLSVIVNSIVGMAVLGFSAGVVFALALALLESGAPADQLTRSRVALAGAIGGALLPTILAFPWLSSLPNMIGTVMSVAIFGALGVASSLGLLRLLRTPLGAGTRSKEPLGMLPHEE